MVWARFREFAGVASRALFLWAAPWDLVSGLAPRVVFGFKPKILVCDTSTSSKTLVVGGVGRPR